MLSFNPKNIPWHLESRLHPLFLLLPILFRARRNLFNFHSTQLQLTLSTNPPIPAPIPHARRKLPHSLHQLSPSSPPMKKSKALHTNSLNLAQFIDSIARLPS